MRTWKKVLFPTVAALLVVTLLGVLSGRQARFVIQSETATRWKDTLEIPLEGEPEDAWDYLALVEKQDLQACRDKTLVKAQLTYGLASGETENISVSFTYSEKNVAGPVYHPKRGIQRRNRVCALRKAE